MATLETDPDRPLPDRPRKGRGAVANMAGRFEREVRAVVDDGWSDPDEEPARLETMVFADTARSAITYNKSPDIGFDRSLNPYRGCEHGCIYCFARPTHAYLGLSPGLDFETKLFAKHDAHVLLERDLRRPGYTPALLALGVNTDAYQPIERELGITRRVLEVLARFKHPVSVISKSALVQRDIDILAPMAAERLTCATVSVTTLDRDLARRMEPRAATPARRLATIEALAKAGIPVTVNVSPTIPGLTDHEMEAILAAARDAGADSASYILIRLPLELRDLFRGWLEAHAPDRAQRVLSLIRQTRGGALYKDAFGERMRGEGPIAELIEKRFRIACRKLGFVRRDWQLDTSRFSVPDGPSDQYELAL